MTKSAFEKRFYNDIINDCVVEFLSDASQSLIDSLEFNGEWWTVKGILISWGYTVIETNDN
jgi:hypothetical protein